MSVNKTNASLTIVAQCPVANNLVAALKENAHKENVEIFVVNKMPMSTLPEDIKSSIGRTQKVLVIEEHISIGGLGSAVSMLANEQSLPLKKFISLRAEGYPNGLYGSQAYHQQLSGLGEENISRIINSYF